MTEAKINIGAGVTPQPQSTGVLTGGVLSTGGGATEFSISDGTGVIIDEAGTVTDVSWSGKTNITPTNLATNLLTWVAIDSGGNVSEQTTPFSASEIRSLICLGVVVHVNLTTVDAVNNQQVVAFNAHSSTYDLADSLGFINKSGNVFSANGINLTLNKSVGEIFATGSNYDTATDNPHIKTLAALTALTFQYRYSDGSNGVTGTLITPDVLDDGAGGTTAVGNNKWSVQRIYSFISNNVKIQLGVEDFATKADAITGLTSEAYITEPSIAANGLLRGWLIVQKGTTDLSDTTKAQFISAGKLGEVGTGGGGSGGSSNWTVPFSPSGFIFDTSNASGGIAWEQSQFNVGEYKFTGEGLQSANAITQQSGTAEATLQTHPAASSLDAAEAFVFTLFGDSGTSGQCKLDITIYGYDSALEGLTTVDTLTAEVAGINGTHDGSDNAATLSDSTASFTVDQLIGCTIYNVTDGSSGVITDNDATTITAALSGGADDNWDTTGGAGGPDTYFIDAPTVITLATSDLTDSTLFRYYTIRIKWYSKDNDAIYLVNGAINGS